MAAPSKNIMVGVRERGKRAGQWGWVDDVIDVHHEVINALREVPVRVVGFQGRKTQLAAVEIMHFLFLDLFYCLASSSMY